MRTYMYRLKDGEVEAKIFDGDIPEGWVDSPAKAKKSESKPIVKKKHGNRK